jgi:hypothetical protein
MIRSVKLLALAATAALALTAFVASAAQAAPEFHAEKVPVIYHGEQVKQHVFTVDTGIVKCNVATFEGTETVNTKTTTTLTPTYQNCTAFGVKATIDTNGCDYLIHLTQGGTTPYPTTTDVNCPTKPIEVTPVGIECIVTVGSQSNLEGMKLTNEGGPTTTRDIFANLEVAGIAYDEHGKECAGGTGTTGGTYKGTATIKGYEDVGGVRGPQQGIWVQ